LQLNFQLFPLSLSIPPRCVGRRCLSRTEPEQPVRLKAAKCVWLFLQDLTKGSRVETCRATQKWEKRTCVKRSCARQVH
jgi:hypothetical protein